MLANRRDGLAADFDSPATRGGGCEQHVFFAEQQSPQQQAAG
jgi:hypothetical protein